jgi:hypothetical protein
MEQAGVRIDSDFYAGTGEKAVLRSVVGVIIQYRSNFDPGILLCPQRTRNVKSRECQQSEIDRMLSSVQRPDDRACGSIRRTEVQLDRRSVDVEDMGCIVKLARTEAGV